MREDQLQEGGGRGLFTLRNLIVLLLGFVLGYFIKAQAVQNITMGYDDYKLSQWNKETVEAKDSSNKEDNNNKEADKNIENENITPSEDSNAEEVSAEVAPENKSAENK